MCLIIKNDIQTHYKVGKLADSALFLLGIGVFLSVQRCDREACKLLVAYFLPLLIAACATHMVAYAQRSTSLRETKNPNAFPMRKMFGLFLYGGRYRTRTYDLPHVKRML